MANIRIVTWNVFLVPYLADKRTSRLSNVIACIKDLDPLPDVICLQEVFFPKHARAIKDALSSAYTVCDVATKKAYPPWFVPGANVGGLFYSIRRSGLLTLVKKTWAVECIKLKHFSSEAPDWKFWEGDGYADKGYLWSVLTHRETGRRIGVVNTHLQAYGAYEQVREKQIGQMAKHVAGISAVMPVVIAGDLNTTENEPLFQRVINKLHWRHISEESTNGCVGGVMTPLRGARAVDHVFIADARRTSIQTRAVSICNRKKAKPYSNHDGVLVDITFPDASRIEKHLATLWKQALTRRSLPSHLWRLWRTFRAL